MDTGSVGPVRHQPVGVPPPSVQEKEKSLGQKITDYFEPRPTTSGDLPFSSATRGAAGGAIQGFFAGGIPAAAGGAAGGFAGTKVGEETGSLKKAIAGGAIVGAGSTLLAASLIPLAMGSPSAICAYLVATGLLSAVSGATGSLMGILGQKKHRDEIQDTLHRAFSPVSPSEVLSPDSEKEGKIPALLGKVWGKIRDLGTRGADGLKKVFKPLGERIGTKALAALMGAGVGAAVATMGGPVGVGIGALVGAVSGFTGAKMAEGMRSVKDQPLGKAMKKGLTLGTALSVPTGTLVGAASLPLLMGNPLIGAALLGAGMIGALTGVVGTLSGSRSSAVRDGSAGGFTIGFFTRAFTGLGGSLIPLAGSVGASVGARAGTDKGRAVLGALVGAATGAIAAILGGPVAMGIGAALGAATGAAGAVAGPKVQQAIRNLSEDLQKKVSSGTDAISNRIIDKLGRKAGVIAMGAAAGAVGSLPLGILAGMVLGPVGFVLPSLAGAMVSSFKFSRYLKDIDNVKLVMQEMEKSGPGIEKLRDKMCQMALNGLKEKMEALPPEEQQKFIDKLRSDTLSELQKAAPVLEKINEGISGEIYAELKKDLARMKTDEEKSRYLEGKIRQAEPVLEQVIIGRLIAVMNQEQEAKGQPG